MQLHARYTRRLQLRCPTTRAHSSSARVQCMTRMTFAAEAASLSRWWYAGWEWGRGRGKRRAFRCFGPAEASEASPVSRVWYLPRTLQGRREGTAGRPLVGGKGASLHPTSGLGPTHSPVFAHSNARCMPLQMRMHPRKANPCFPRSLLPTPPSTTHRNLAPRATKQRVTFARPANDMERRHVTMFDNHGPFSVHPSACNAHTIVSDRRTMF